MAGTGSVAGTVTDPSGAVVVGAQVTLTDASTNAQRTATSNEAGRYLFPNLPPGTYSMTTTKEGFRVAKVSSLTVNLGTTLTVDVAMELGTVSQTVEVVATPSELQVTNSTIGNTVSGDMLQSLPSLGRDVSSFVT
ncbi:MAG: carboxypeptidase regulatory-like domain-containing protein, partial [Acidobacteria bacterium]